MCDFLVVFICRAFFKIKVEGQEEVLYFNDPRAAAAASLSIAFPYSGPMLYSFLEAGGLHALVRMLGESSCPVALGYTLDLMEELIKGGSRGIPAVSDWGQEFAHKFNNLGARGDLAICQC
jgi:hypothetical protein